ncbi:origin recognition complex subunit 3 N-terminus-domain-containing protein [Chaetomidium leptoderma]|uniref:Origin recognition complex subunit 3 N-terminus-domain-containing protein n=1 Tax=Chaetomidium leptoderma TaxID=669021 RepID=A0AAN6VUW9_9PEZI|nr:origin recognition complex subunit 3 N-terminus-domain-containing protein [Chaetomidium leptoderma]
MAENENISVSFEEDDHRAAFVFNPEDGQGNNTKQQQTARPAKRRKVAKADAPKLQSTSAAVAAGPAFPPLFNGAESPDAVRLRRELFETVWPHVLREANRTTLDEVTAFLQQAAEAETGKITAGFIITGPNIASQGLLFEQLAERLCTATQAAKFVRLRASEAPNLKAVLKRIIRDATATRGAADGDGEGEDDVDAEVAQGGRKYLDYDLEALHVFLSRQQKQQSRRVVVAFQDSEAFESGLLTDLITLFHSWRDRIQFDVLFGVATSVELFQARLLKSTARQLYGAQFDVVQANSVLESVIKSAVAGTQAGLRIGPSLLRSLVERQQDQVAGIQVFISSLKYAYMCHFYANPLSVLLAGDGRLDRQLLQPEHIEAVRTLDSFQAQAEAAVGARQLNHAQLLIEDDEYLVAQVMELGQKRKEYLTQLLRSLHLAASTGLSSAPFTDLYILALSSGIDIDQSSGTLPLEDAVKRLSPGELISLIDSLLSAIQTGSPEIGLEGWESDAEEFVGPLTDLRDEIEGLIERSKSNGTALKSKYSAQSRVMRTTVVAQKVQLSQDSATLTDEDKAFTKAVDTLLGLLSQNLHCDPVDNLFLHEVWVFDSKSPYRDVFVPRPGATFGRALARPHDYLACACCAQANGGLESTLPTTAILYHLYLEAGALLNVADLWSAYYALVGDESDVGLDERSALVCFYRGLAELGTMGFVKPSKKKADHVAKLKHWTVVQRRPKANSGRDYYILLLAATRRLQHNTRRAATNPAFHAKLSQMTLQLAPLVQLTTGAIHPSFPRTLLAFWLLTDAQLDALAHFYHQRTPGPWTRQYPCPVSWPAGLGLEEKRRKLGRFIGLRGCDSPSLGVVVLENGVGEMLGRTEEEIVEGARRERVRRGEEVEEVRRKMGWF